MPNYQFRFEVNAVPTQLENCDVLGEININREQEDGEIFFRRKLGGNLKFVGDAYAFLKTYDNTSSACTEIEFVIERECASSGVFTEYWRGFFTLSNASINNDACFIEVNPEVVDQYTCLMKRYGIEERNPFDTDINALLSPADFQPITWLTHNMSFAFTTFLYQGIEIKETALVPDIPDSNWKPDQFPKGVSYNGTSIEGFEDLFVIYECAITRTGSSPNPGFGIYDVSGSVICEIKGQVNRPDGAGWRYFGSNQWLRPYTNDIYGDISHGLTGVNPNYGYDMADPDADLYDSNILDFQNEMCFFNSYIEAFAELLCNLPVRSEVMGINPNDPAALLTNPVHGGVNEWPLTMITDVKWVERPWRTWANEPDTHTRLSLRDILEGLKAHEFYWYIDSSGTLVIDHISIIRTQNPLNLTTDRYADCFVNKDAFSYDNIENVRNEEWDYPNSFFYDFTGEPVRYDSPCTDYGEAEKNKVRTLPWTTDFFNIATYPESFDPDKVLLVTLNGTQIPPFGPIVRDSVGALSGFTRSNNELSNANMQDKYSRWNRVLLNGEMNLVNTVFNSAQKFRKQVPVQIPFCCDDPEFDDLSDIITKFGTAELVSATEKTKTDTLVLELKYE